MSYAEVLARADGRVLPAEVFLQEVTLRRRDADGDPDGARHQRADRRPGPARPDRRRRATAGRGAARGASRRWARACWWSMPTAPSRWPTRPRAACSAWTSPDGLADASSAGCGRPTTRTTRETVLLDDGRWIEITTYPADLGGGIADRARASRIVILRDVTRDRTAEAAREAFLGVLSHELRTPVTTIFGYAKILQRPAPREDQAELLGDIEAESDRLYRIVEDLLALSRVEGGITIDGEPVLVQHIVEPVVASESQRWSGITFETSLPLDLPGGVRRADVRRAGAPQPRLERREVRDARDHRHDRGRRGRRRGDRPRAGPGHRRRARGGGAGCSSCSTARRSRRARRPGPGSACTSAAA